MMELTLRESTARLMHPLILEFLEAGPDPHSRRLELMAAAGHLRGLNLNRFDYGYTTPKDRVKKYRGESRDARRQAHADREAAAALGVKVYDWRVVVLCPSGTREAVLREAAELIKTVTKRGDREGKVILPLVAKYGVSATTVRLWIRKDAAARLAENP